MSRSSRALAPLLLFVGLAGSGPAAASTPEADRTAETSASTWAGWLGLGVGVQGDRTAVELDGRDFVDDRSSLATRVELGLAHPLEAPVPWGGLELLGRLGLGLDLAEARGALGLDAELRWRIELGPLEPFLGLGLGARLDLAGGRSSTLGLQLPLGLRWGWAELAWAPELVLPIGTASATLLGGERRDGARPGLGLGTVALRARILRF